MGDAKVVGKSPLACLILAAGKGTRMNSARTKVLHPLLGTPLISYPVELALELRASPIVAVLGHQLADVERVLVARHGAGAVLVVEQAEQKGTGHAVKLGLAPLRTWNGIVLILCGDVPLLHRETVNALVDKARRTGGLAVLTAEVADPTGYGRIVRGKDRRVAGIVEHKDASAAERRIREVNAGIYAAPADFLRKATARIGSKNAQREFYLTGIVARAARSIGAVAVGVAPQDMVGINDRAQLAAAEKIMRGRIVSHWGKHVTFRDPDSVSIDRAVKLGPDVEIGRNVSLCGRTVIGAGTRIGDGVVLIDTEVGQGVEIRPYCVASSAKIGPGAKIGPFAHLRPGTELGPDVHVGNFVETKMAVLGRGSKANHLSYLGDVTVGEKVNVGAGTITCNYNGYEKSRTVIEDGAFIGSDAQLVAPVRVGRRAVVAAGTTITEDVPEGALAITRPEQRHIAGYADRLAARYKKPEKT